MGALFLAEASEPQEFAVPSSKQDSACVYLLRTSVMRYQTDNDVCLFKKSIIFLIFRCFRQHMRSSSTQAILWPSGLVSYSGWSSNMIQSVSERGHGKITTSTPSTQSWWSLISSSRGAKCSWPTTGWWVWRFNNVFSLSYVLVTYFFSAPLLEPILRIHPRAYIWLHEMEERLGRIEGLSHHQLAGDPSAILNGVRRPLRLTSRHSRGLCCPFQCIIILVFQEAATHSTQEFA